jgi:hypothetical protein
VKAISKQLPTTEEVQSPSRKVLKHPYVFAM